MLASTVLFTLLASWTFAQGPPIVPVQPFTPAPIRITLDDLPPPFKTTSATKPAIVVGIPTNATLMVPDLKFRVSIYRDGMKTPRQMIYTPTGDILVTEDHGNRISILIGDKTQVFADQTNAISEAFGMAFVDVSQSNWRIVRLSFTTEDRSRVGSMQRIPVNYADIRTRPVIRNSAARAKC